MSRLLSATHPCYPRSAEPRVALHWVIHSAEMYLELSILAKTAAVMLGLQGR